MNKKKTVLLTDQSHIDLAQVKREEIEQAGHVCEFILVRRGTNYDEIFPQQPLGSQVLICTQEKELQNIRQAALRGGFVKKDILVIMQKEHPMRVFCSQCHAIQQVDQKEGFICEYCRQKIEPSDHYSDYHLAYLAYPSFD